LGFDLLRKEWGDYLTLPGRGTKKTQLKARFPTKDSMITYLEAGGVTVRRDTNKKELEGMVKETLPPKGDLWYRETLNRLKLK